MRPESSSVELLARLAIDRLKPLCVRVGGDMRVVSVFGDPAYYGYPGLTVGADSLEQLDFLFGLDVTQRTELPFLGTPNGGAADVSITPARDGCEIVFIDTRCEREQRRRIQQQANELTLMNERQQALVEALETATEELELKRREAEDASRMKSRFIATMSHEFRTPLTSILGYSRLLLGDRRSALDPAAGLAAVERAAKHLLTLVENLLEQAQIEMGDSRINRGPVPLGALMREMDDFFRPIAAAKHLGFATELAPDVPAVVEADPMRLRQILINLIGNACKYTRAGRVRVTVSWRDGCLAFTIEDTGPGIAREEQASIFRPFHRTAAAAERGAGLGLSITCRIVELMDGTLALESEPGRGTRVAVRIPSRALPDPDAAVVERAPPPGGRKVVLLTEDDRDVLDIVETYLEEAGCRVVRAETGHDAIRAAGRQALDLVMVDLNLPDIDGCEVVRRLRGNGFRKPIVILTASTIQADRERALDAGCDEFLVKPVIVPQLIGLVRRLTREP